MMQNPETGTRDITYNLMSVAYHALQGAETYGVYIRDAHEAGDTELADFFTRVQDHNRLIADEAKRFIGARMTTAKQAIG